MKQNIETNWMNPYIQDECKINELKNINDGLYLCAKAYKSIFNGEPFYEDWTIESSKDQIKSYIDNDALIISPTFENDIIGFLVAMNGVPNDQKEYVPYKDNEIRYIEEIGVVKDYRNQQIASEMVRILLLKYLQFQERYIIYRTNAMRYFELKGGESFEAGVIRTQKEDKIKRLNNENIIIPEFTQTEKQDFINKYMELLKYRPDLDVSHSNKLFRSIFDNLEFCNQNGIYYFQEDPSLNGNDRIFPVIDLSKVMLVRRK